MKRWIGLAVLIFVGTAGWRIGETLSPDALSMAVGVLFGVMAGVPTALFVMAGSRRRSDERAETSHQREQHRDQHSQLMRANGPVYGQMPGYGYGNGHGQGHGYGQVNQWGQPPYAQQPPIIIVAGPQGFGNALPPAQANANMGWLPQDIPARQFTVVGNGEELVEEW